MPNNARGITLPGFKTYCKVTAIETLWCWQTNRHVSQWNRIEQLEMDLNIHGQVTFNKNAKATQWGKHAIFMVLGKLDLYMPKNKFRPLPFTMYKN